MKHYVGPYRAVTDDEFAELALGTPLELWLGVEEESPEDREARLAAARDILADNPGLADRAADLVATTFAVEYDEVLRVLALAEPVRLSPGRRRAAERRAA